MSNPMKPTTEQLLKYHVLKHSVPHMTWVQAKNKAAKHVDVKVFKRDMGKALDSLRDICEGGINAKKHGKLDDKTLKVVRERKTKLEKIIMEYQAICTNEAKKPGVSAAAKQAWGDLKAQLDTTAAAPDNMSRAVLRG